MTEAPTTNLFMVGADGGLATPPGNKVLLGITRDTVLALAPSVGFRCVERDIAAAELASAREVFLSGTSVGVWPVLSIDQKQVGDGGIGAATRKLRTKYDATVRGEEPDFEHWLHYV